MKTWYYENSEGKVRTVSAKSADAAANFLPDGATLLNEVDRQNMPDPAHKDLWTNDGSGNAEIKSADLTAKERADKLSQIREARKPKYEKADDQLRMHADGDANAIATEAEWKTYRIDLRNITETYKDAQGDPNSSLDAVSDIEADVSWPAEPTDA